MVKIEYIKAEATDLGIAINRAFVLQESHITTSFSKGKDAIFTYLKFPFNT